MQTPKINKSLYQTDDLNIAPLMWIVLISRNKQKRHIKATKQNGFFSFYLIKCLLTKAGIIHLNLHENTFDSKKLYKC